MLISLVRLSPVCDPQTLYLPKIGLLGLEGLHIIIQFGLVSLRYISVGGIAVVWWTE